MVTPRSALWHISCGYLISWLFSCGFLLVFLTHAACVTKASIHKQAEESLREAKKLLEKTFASLGDALFVLDRDRRTIIGCNAAVERIFGYSEKEVIGRNTEFLHVNREMYEDFSKALLTSLEANGVYHGEYRMRRKDGTLFSTDHTVTPIVDNSGRRTALVSVVRDTTDRQRAQEALHRTEAELRRLSSQLLEVQENERKRISRELHDSIGQVLASVKVGLENAVRNIRQGMSSSSVESLETLISVVQQACEEVRRLHADLRPPVLDDLGIISTIFWFCREFEKVYSGIRIEKQIDVEEKQVPEPLKIVIFRVLQEALNNASKHAKANLVRLFMKAKAGKIELVIEDNGQGFNVEQANSLKLLDWGFGLTSMKERTEVMGGSFSVKSVEGAGTTIRASWPMKQ
jgi:PAS domain S-box-containing protein